jgi:hypothetical protein
MILLKICIFSALSLSGHQHSDGKRIEVIGKALNAKAGAVVVDADQVTYYVDGREFWDKKVYGKKSRCQGSWSLRIHPKTIIRDYRRRK